MAIFGLAIPAFVSLVAGVAGAGAAVHGTVQSAKQSRRQARLQEAAARREQRAMDLQQARERTRTIAEARRRRAASLQSAVNQGAGGSSSAIGAAGSVRSQAASNLSFLDQQANINRQISGINTQIQQSVGRQATARGISNIGQTIFNSRDDIGSIFE